MRLVVVTQQVDPASPVLGATVDEAAVRSRERVDELVVLADSAVDGALPDNCRVRALPRARDARGAASGSRARSRASSPGGRDRPRFSRTCARSTPCSPRRSRGRSASTCCSGSPTGAGATLLRTAERALDEGPERRRADVSRSRSRKLVAIGHGIDVSASPASTGPEREPLTLLALGRTSPAKGLETILRAVEQLVPDVRLRRRPVGDRGGAALPDRDRAPRDRARPARPRRHPRPGAAPRRPRRSTREVDALVNDMRAGATDKVVYEAAATCLPVIASNPAFDAPAARRAAVRARRRGGPRGRDRAACARSTGTPSGGAARAPSLREHSVDVWAERVVELAA